MQTRIVTGVVAGGFFILLLWLGGIWFAGLITLLAIIGFNEYLRMNKFNLNPIAAAVLVGVGMVCLIGPMFGFTGRLFTVEIMIWLLLFILLGMTVISKNRLTLDHASVLFAGIIYLGYGFYYMIYTRMMEPDGLFWTLCVFLCIWATDTGAYFSGRFFGKHKLWPSISPNKTIEGAVGGILVAVLVALVFSFVHPELMSAGQAVLLGIVIAAAGQIGDLIQSAYKRVRGIKDTGTLLPGHGGVLDRVDSWLIVFPIVHLLSLIP